MSKTLSNGVLSLRFMQNAQRAKQLKEVELHRAEVADEGKWVVSQTVREAWGLTEETNQDQDVDIHEVSYLPFLYSNEAEGDSEDPPPMTLGRRIFKHTILDSVPDDTSEGTEGKDAPTPSNNSSKLPKGRIHAHPRPISISSLSNAKATLLKGFDQLGEPNHRKLRGKEIQVPKSTARELIFDSGNVGVDLRDQGSSKAIPTFMKPAGVDDPKEAVSSATKINSEVGAQIIDGARQKPKKTKRERDLDEGDGVEDEVKKKSKKKKKRN